MGCVMRKGVWILAAIGVLAVGAAAYGLATVYAPNAAERLRDQIKIEGYQRTAAISEVYAGNVDATGIYVGPPVQGDLGRVISLPGLVLTMLPSPPPGVNPQPNDNTDWIATGRVPNGCTVHVYKFRKDKLPFDSWHISEAGLKDVRAGKSDILEVAVVCGEG